MGWLFTDRHDSLADYRDYRIRHHLQGEELVKADGSKSGRRYRALKTASKGWRGLGRIWCLCVIEDVQTGQVLDSFIFVDLITSYQEDRVLWCGYKDVDLDMGPCETDCPVGFIKEYAELPKSSEVGQYQRNWLLKFAEAHPTAREAVQKIVTPKAA